MVELGIRDRIATDMASWDGLEQNPVLIVGDLTPPKIFILYQKSVHLYCGLVKFWGGGLGLGRQR